MKTCRVCKEHRPLNDFGKNIRMKDGHQPHCKKCAYEQTKKYVTTDQGKALKLESTRRWRARYPKKMSAIRRIDKAIARKQIIKPDACEYCNSTKRIEAHHEDYDYPFDVTWLCSACHAFWHQINGEAANASD